MLKVRRKETSSFRPLDPLVTKIDFTSHANSTHDQCFAGIGSSVDVHEEPTMTSAPNRSGDFNSVLYTDPQCYAFTTNPASNGKTLTAGLQDLDANAFLPHATHLVPSERNGTWRAQACYALRNYSGPGSTLHRVLEHDADELNVFTLLPKLKHLAKDQAENFENWLNRSLANYDMVEMHNQVRCLVPVISMPSIRQLDQVVDNVTGFVQSLPKNHPGPELSESVQKDKHTFAEFMAQKACRGLIREGICKEWQFLTEEHAKLQYVMQLALIRTFTCIRHFCKGVPLFRAKPQWVPDREKKVWRLELDAGVVGVEVGPVTDVSLVQLGFIDTGFELPESCGCATITELDRQDQEVENEWQLLEV